MPLINNRTLTDADTGYDRQGEYDRKKQAILGDTTVDMPAKLARLKDLDVQYGKAQAPAPAPAPTPTPAPANPAPTNYQKFKDAQTDAADSFTAGLSETPTPAPALAPLDYMQKTYVPDAVVQNVKDGLDKQYAQQKQAILADSTMDPHAKDAQLLDLDVRYGKKNSQDDDFTRALGGGGPSLTLPDTRPKATYTPTPDWLNQTPEVKYLQSSGVPDTVVQNVQNELAKQYNQKKQNILDDTTIDMPTKAARLQNLQDDMLKRTVDGINPKTGRPNIAGYDLTDNDCYLIQNLYYGTKYTPKQVIQIFQKLKENNGIISAQDMVNILDSKSSDLFETPDDLAALANLAYRVAMFGTTFNTLDANQRKETFDRALGIIGMSALSPGKSGGNSGGVKEPEFKPFDFGPEEETPSEGQNGNKTEADKAFEDGLGLAKEPEIKTAEGLKEHIISGDNVPTATREINGAHNKNVFDQYLDDINVLDRTPDSKVKGVERVTYQVHTMDKAGNPTEGWKSTTYTKTVYDPAVISDDEYYQWGMEAAGDAKQRGVLGREWTGTAKNGIKYRGYTNENGEITSFFILTDN